jgi:hypothetical protein
MNASKVTMMDTSSPDATKLFWFKNVANVKKKLFKSMLAIAVIAGIAITYGPAIVYRVESYLPIQVKHNEEYVLETGQPLVSGTQSINRYHSALRELDTLLVDYDNDKKLMGIKLVAEGQANAKYVYLKDLDSRYLTPLLPYQHGRELTEFDSYNLMLAEYARSGMNLSFQESNKYFGTFSASDNVFDDKGEYIYQNDKILPNSKVRPTRISIINNCLTPGLWEISAADSVGEMYHGWFTLPRETYFEMVRENNSLSVSQETLRKTLAYDGTAEVLLNLDKLRNKIDTIQTSDLSITYDKKLGSYSSQDSRRKTQRSFYSVERDGEEIDAQTFADLIKGDVFSLYKFVSPGVYSTKKEEVNYDPSWSNVEINTVSPLTSYDGNQSKYNDNESVEIIIYSQDRQRAIILGNIPLSLLVYQDDYVIPAFGVGVLSSSEHIERRYLRIKEGPKPHYAYLTKLDENEFYGLNNHKYGLEQIFLRPIKRGQKVYLRVFLVSYERITDLLELEILLDEKLAMKIDKSSEVFKTPLFRRYQDNNII